MAQRNNNYDSRDLRMDCLKLAATMVMQLKAKHDSIVPTAREFLKFIVEADDDLGH